jgi:hypothetical protein
VADVFKRCGECGREEKEVVPGFGLGDLLQSMVTGAAMAIGLNALRGELNLRLDTAPECQCPPCKEIRSLLAADLKAEGPDFQRKAVDRG